MQAHEDTYPNSVLIRTPRLSVRKLEAADVEVMYSVYGDTEAMRFVGDGTPLTRTDCERWIEITHRNYAHRGYGMFVVVLAASGNAVGFCGLVHPANQTQPELKYAYRREHWGNGYATEAAAALLAFGARQFDLKEVVATAAPEHAVSHRVLLKAGMERAVPRQNQDGSFTEVFTWRPRDREVEI
jgi:RimJ/RimL family protein N-acetyltransferase